MIKIAALNEESEEDSDSEEEVTREALEQIALQQYAKALELQRKGNLSDAMQLLNDLLETELLDDVKKPAPGEKPIEPLFNLKYLCYKNVASMQTSIGENDRAIESYTSAAELDDTDVTLWHRLGLTCIKVQDYEKALYSFQQGTKCNPRHWPCIDKIVTLQLGLGYHNDCLATIYNAFELDPDYLRGITYKKHIYENYHYVHDFLSLLDTKYKWNEYDTESIDDQKAEKLLKEAEDIHNTFVDQLNSEKFKYVLPQLKLINPITNLTWQSVGESLVHMHHYMTEHCYSHACVLELNYKKCDPVEEPMEVCEEEPVLILEDTEKLTECTEPKVEEVVEGDKNIENGSDDNNEHSDKAATDTEKIEESDMEVAATETPMDVQNQVAESKESKKTSSRRRGSALSFLQQWEWCTKRRSGRKKTTNKQDQDDENIYETLRRMIPTWLVPERENKENDETRALSPELVDLCKLFENEVSSETKKKYENYFGSEAENNEVKDFIQKYITNKCDIIEILKDYLFILSRKWKIQWPIGFWKIFIEANKCYDNHIDIPSCCEENRDEIIHYSFVNMLCEEFKVNDKLEAKIEDKQLHELNVVENIGILLNNKPNIFGSDCFELMLRYLWVKLHIHILNKSEELALDRLYQLIYEFECMGEHHDSYSLELVNFSFKPLIRESQVTEYINFLERNKKLSTVRELYKKGSYDEVLSIVVDSFEHSKNSGSKQEEEMSLDFAVQLSLIIDCYWALNKVDDCFKWSLTCLHEALKHYFLSNPGSPEQKKWSLTTVKVLCCIEHILTTEGLSSLDNLSQKELSIILEDLIKLVGHQVDTNAPEMPFDTVAPWVIMYYILQREDDHGRSRKFSDKDTEASDEIPNPIMVLFVAHEHLGNHGWCMKSNGKLLYFILDTVVPRLRSPSLAKSLEQVCQHMEQCVFCLFGHPGKKTKLKYLSDHKVSPHSLDWPRAQQIYEIFKPSSMPELEGKVPSISTETEQLFHRILAILPTDCDPRKYLSEMEKYLNGKHEKLPIIPALLPYKMKDIYFLLGDYYFKKEERKRSVKFNTYDTIVNNDRFESWAEIALAKAVNLELKLNSCSNFDNEKDYLNPAKVIIRCFKRALHLDSMYVNLWVEYGAFVYSVYSFCSRLLKQASESLSMQDFESLELQKEAMLDQTHKCFTTVIQDRLNASNDDKDKVNDEMWLHYYMMGKVAEKRNKPPSVYLNFYMKAIQSLNEADALYPTKINYNSPQHLSIEVLEVHYRIHASILKYIEQHENKAIPVSVGKVFSNAIKEWKTGPFTKKLKKDDIVEAENDTKPAEGGQQAGNILKRSISDAGEEDNQESKKLKFESAAAKVKRSASYDTERLSSNEQPNTIAEETKLLTLPMDFQVAKDTKNVEEQTNNHMNGNLDPKMNVDTETKTDDVNQKPVEDQPVTSDIKEDTLSVTSTNSSSDSSSDDSSTDSSTTTSRDTDASSKSGNGNKPMTDTELMEIICGCLDALEDCSSRFPQHYKAIYRLAHYHFYYKKGKDIERCRDLMLSNYTSRSNQKLGGLFSERKQTNFFNAVWRIPSGEVDRPGGFSCHMNRCVLLTMEILKEIDDHKTLLELSMHLQRVPDSDKKYLRDEDREDLAQQAFLLCIQSLKGQLVKFSQQTDLKSNKVEKHAFNSLMLDIYRAYMKAQKQPNSKQFTNLLIEGYKLVCPTTSSENTNFIDISMKYCQSLIAALKQKATLASIDKNNQNAQKKQAAKVAAAAAATLIISTATTTAATTTIPADTIKGTSQSHTKIDNKKALPTMSPQDMAAIIQSYLPLVSPQTAMMLYSGLENYSLPGSLQSPTQSAIPLASNIPSALQNSLSNNLQAALQSSYSNPLPPTLQNIQSALQNTLQTPLQSSMQNPLQTSMQSMLQPPMQNTFQSEFYRRLLSTNYSSYNLSPPKKQRSKQTPMRPQTSGQSTHTKTTSRSSNATSTSSAYVSQSRSNLVATINTTSSSSTYGSHGRGVSETNTKTSSTIGSHSRSHSSTHTNSSSSYMTHSKNNLSSSGTSLASVPYSRSTSGMASTNTSSSFHRNNSHSTKTLTSNSQSKSFPSTVSNNASSSHRIISNTSANTAIATSSTGSYGNAAKPAHMSATSQSTHLSGSIPIQAHKSISSTVNAAVHSKPPLPHQQVSPGKTLQEKLAEKQKHPTGKPNTHEINASINRLPPSVTITKTNASKKQVSKKSHSKEKSWPKPTLSTDEIIVLDDDDD